MTETTRKVFDTYQVRKTKKQKSAFIQYVKEQAEAGGYTCRVEKGMLGARNIVIGEPDAARVVYTAHYDTCPRLPFPNFITPKNIWIYLLYQVALVLLLMIPVFLVSVGLGFVVGWIWMAIRLRFWHLFLRRWRGFVCWSCCWPALPIRTQPMTIRPA